MVKNAKGFTLVETLLVVTILGIVAMVGPPIIVNVVRFFMMHSTRAEIQQDARVCLDVINRTLRQAVSSSIVIDQVSGQPGGSRITFQNLDGDTIIFYQSGKQLIQSVTAGGSTHTTPLARTLRYLAFTYPRSDDPTIISVALTMEKGIYEGQKKALELSIEKVRVMN
ncbi:MAG: type II secretion system protein [Elusimicrobiota bacterium]|jgi:prepilin-type N-terminal cleavage/methylation domain-containing protein